MSGQNDAAYQAADIAGTQTTGVPWGSIAKAVVTLFGSSGDSHSDPRWDPKAEEHTNPVTGNPRTPPAWFDAEAYFMANPDVIKSTYGSHPYDHYVDWGMEEGRKTAPDNWGVVSVKRKSAYMSGLTPLTMDNVTQAYREAYGRDPAQPEINWQLTNTQSLEDLYAGIGTSPESIQKWGAPRDFSLKPQLNAGATAGSGVDANSAATAAAKLMNTGAITPSVASAPKNDAGLNWTIIGVLVSIVALIIMMKGK